MKPTSNQLRLRRLRGILLFMLTVAAAFYAPTRTMLIALLILVVPGYCITSAMFTPQALGFWERLLFSVGLSLVTGALGGLVLDWTPWGLQAGSWAALFIGVSLAAGLIGVFRHGWRSLRIPLRVPETGIVEVSLFGLALALIGVAVGIGRMPTSQTGLQGYAVMWIQPTDGQHVRVGVQSSEFSATSYRLAVVLDTRTLEEWPTISLQPGQAWETTVELPTTLTGEQPVEAILYRVAVPGQVYRHVKWWPQQRSP